MPEWGGIPECNDGSRHMTLQNARVVEWQTRRSQKPVSLKLVSVRLRPRAHGNLSNFNHSRNYLLYILFTRIRYPFFPNSQR